MFGNLGMGEIIIVAGIALVVIGPEKFPEFAKIALRAFRDLRGYLDEAKKEISDELKPVKKEIEQLSRYDPEDYIDTLTAAVTGEDEEDSTDAAPDSSPSEADAGQQTDDAGHPPADQQETDHLPDPYAEESDSPDQDARDSNLEEIESLED